MAEVATALGRLPAWPSTRRAMAGLDGAERQALLSCEFFDSNRTPFDLQITLIFLEEEEEERKGWLDFGESKGMDPAGLDKLSFFLSFFPRSFSRYCLLVKEQRGERSVCNWGNRVRWAVRYEEIDAIVWILCGEWYIYIYIVCVLSLFEGEGRNWWYYRCFSWNS